MALASPSILVIERAPQNGCHQCLCLPGECQLPPASPGDSPRLTSGSDPGLFQIPASALGSGVWDFVCIL